MRFSLSHEPVEPERLRRELKDVSAGGYCAFEGWVRNHHLGRDVTSLTYEAYEPMALKQGDRVLEEALAKFEIIDARAVHRIGDLRPGDLAIWIGVTAAHRAEAFEACRYLIDTIKDTVPVWKHEFYADGTGEWVDPTACGCHAHREESR